MVAKKPAEAVLQITQVRSLIGQREGHRRTVRALGLRRIGHQVTQPDRPEIRGMIAKVTHLVDVDQAPAAKASSAAKPKASKPKASAAESAEEAKG